MEDMKRKNKQLEFLLAENQLLKQHTEEQEEQVAELKQEWEGDDYLCDFVVHLWKQIFLMLIYYIIEKEKVMKKLYIDLDRKSEIDEKTLLKQQLAKQVQDAHTQSEISFPILGQSRVNIHIIAVYNVLFVEQVM